MIPRIPLLAVFATVALWPAVQADELGTNLSFDELVERPDGGSSLAGWRINQGDTQIRLDNEVVRTGINSLRFQYAEGGRGSSINQTLDLDSVRNRTLVVGGYLRGVGIAGSYSGLFARADGESGILALAYLDLHEPRGAFAWTRFELRIPVDRLATAVYIGVDVRGEGTLWVDDLYVRTETRPRSRPSAEVTSYLDHIWDVFRSRSILRDAVDWDDLRDTTDRQVRGARFTDQAWAAVRGALKRIGDGHSQFWTPADVVRVRSQRPAPREAIESTPTAKVLDGEVGYVTVPRFINNEDSTEIRYAEILHALITQIEGHGPCAYIVDLRGNTGGNLWPMLLGIGPLLGSGEVGAFVGPDGEGSAWQIGEYGVLDGEETVLALEQAVPVLDPAPPVAVLTDRRTGSSGEAVTAAFRGRPDTLSFGQDTNGVSTGLQGFAQADGSRIFLTTTAVADRTGTTYGKKIPVEHPVAPATEAVELDDDPVVQAARAWLHETYACG
jgi:carboxyl-terminal processing protease